MTTCQRRMRLFRSGPARGSSFLWTIENAGRAAYVPSLQRTAKAVGGRFADVAWSAGVPDIRPAFPAALSNKSSAFARVHSFGRLERRVPLNKADTGGRKELVSGRAKQNVTFGKNSAVTWIAGILSAALPAV